jgi:6-phosphogluconate dehydrogenase (decarboxylating)
MQLGMIGLGRMGANMMRRLLKAGHQCVVFATSSQAVSELVAENAVGASQLARPSRLSEQDSVGHALRIRWTAGLL